MNENIIISKPDHLDFLRDCLSFEITEQHYRFIKDSSCRAEFAINNDAPPVIILENCYMLPINTMCLSEIKYLEEEYHHKSYIPIYESKLSIEFCRYIILKLKELYPKGTKYKICDDIEVSSGDFIKNGSTIVDKQSHDYSPMMFISSLIYPEIIH